MLPDFDMLKFLSETKEWCLEYLKVVFKEGNLKSDQRFNIAADIFVFVAWIVFLVAGAFFGIWKGAVVITFAILMCFATLSLYFGFQPFDG
jgi:ABC-type uncharacterized transport system permease subunit